MCVCVCVSTHVHNENFINIQRERIVVKFKWVFFRHFVDIFKKLAYKISKNQMVRVSKV